MEDFINHNFNVSKIVTVCYVAPGTGTPVHKNRPSHGLALHLGGKRYYNFSGGKRILVRQGDLIYMPKGSNYVVEGIKTDGVYAINFDLSESVSFSPFAIKVKNLGAFLEYFKQAENAWRMKKQGFEMRCKSLLYTIILDMIKEYSYGYVPSSTEELITPAVAYIHNEYTGETISIAALAKMCGVSETHFRKIFSTVKGCSPVEYINSLKLSRAKELLSSGMYTVSEVSEQAGFHDESYFSRFFKKETGIPPSKYK